MAHFLSKHCFCVLKEVFLQCFHILFCIDSSEGSITPLKCVRDFFGCKNPSILSPDLRIFPDFKRISRILSDFCIFLPGFPPPSNPTEMAVSFNNKSLLDCSDYRQMLITTFSLIHAILREESINASFLGNCHF